MNSVERGRWKLVISISAVRKAVAGRDEDVGRAGPAARAPSSRAGTLQQTQRGRADSDDAPAPRLGRVQRVGGCLADRTGLGVHLVVGGIVHLHRQERTGADMQGDEAALDAFGIECGKQLGREMQARSGRRDGASSLA